MSIIAYLAPSVFETFVAPALNNACGDPPSFEISGEDISFGCLINRRGLDSIL